MKRLSVFIILIFSLLIVGLPLAQQTRGMKAVGKASEVLPGVVVYRTGWALIIGINKYPHLKAEYQLGYAVADAEALANLLENKFGYPRSNITILKDEQATRNGILQAFASLADHDRVKENDCVLVFYSGHGQTVDTSEGGITGYIIPHDAKVNLSRKPNPSEYILTCINMNELYQTSKLFAAKHTLFIMDACLLGGIVGKARGGFDTEVPDYMKRVVEWPVKQMITGGGKDQESLERPDLGHGVFSYKMLDGLEREMADWDNDGIIRGSELGNYLRMSVPKMNDKQTPMFGVEGEGEFLFLSQIEEEEPEEPEVITEITELASKAKLFVSSKPDGASVYVDEKMVGKTPCAVELDAGVTGKREVTVAVSKKNYETKRAKVTLVAGKTAKWSDVKLNQIAMPAVIEPDSIDSEPSVKIEPVVTPIGEIGFTPPGAVDAGDMVLIPAGEFQMGDGSDEHTVYLDAFYMDKYEVTNAQFNKFIEATEHRKPANWRDKNLNVPDHPVVGVSWDDAVAYCQWAGKRLPTEAEWEKAARGGKMGQKYPWGDDGSSTYERANIFSKRGKDIWSYTAPVGSFEPNDYGLYDMAGNAREWCSDLYDMGYYSKSPARNPKGPEKGTQRVMRGGGWRLDASYLIVSKRYYRSPTSTYDEQGFRCAKDATP